MSKLGILGIILDNGWEAPSRSVIKTRGSRKMKGLFVLTVLFLLAQSGMAAFDLATLEVNDQVKIVAHRGYVAKGGRKFSRSTRAAAKEKASYVEMDILLTKDHQFVSCMTTISNALAGWTRMSKI